MNVGESLIQYRREMADVAAPHFWKDEEILRYADDAYKMFARLTGGIADCTSDLTAVDIVAGEATAEIDKRILRVMSVTRASDGQEIKVVNQTDLMTAARDDYGIVRRLYNDSTPGAVRYMVIGTQRGLVRWVQVPDADDQARLYVYRLPLTTVEADGSNADFEFDEIGEEHHPHLLLWMRRCGYMKHDTDSFDPVKAGQFEALFRDYCERAKAEWERYKHKTRVVAYGGL